MSDIDLDHLKAWIGKSNQTEEAITKGLSDRLHATLGFEQEEDGALPHGAHWCVCVPITAIADIAPDGHAKRGEFLPPIPLPRRMWAGSEIVFGRSLKVGDMVKRRSTIENVYVKHGRSGPLCFVDVRHYYSVEDEMAVDELQTVVYRESSRESSGVSSAENVLNPPRMRIFDVRTTTFPMSEVLLFRYSAVTFNPHRIHYDNKYVTEVEGYPGLIVHGPLQATLLMGFARDSLGKSLKKFTFRGLSPMFGGPAFDIFGVKGEDGSLSLEAVTVGDVATMQATAS